MKSITDCVLAKRVGRGAKDRVGDRVARLSADPRRRERPASKAAGRDIARIDRGWVPSDMSASPKLQASGMTLGIRRRHVQLSKKNRDSATIGSDAARSA